MQRYDVIIIGASASGLMCAISSAKNGKKTLVLDHSNKIGKKILMSGGGRCNFTNYYIEPEKYISQNKHFCKSALSRFTQWDMISLIEKHGIEYYEKTLGQLFCKNKSQQIVDMLVGEVENSGAMIKLNTKVFDVEKANDEFKIPTAKGYLYTKSVVIATGGISIPTLGATPFGYEIAQKFGHSIVPVRAGLVPFTYSNKDKEKLISLAGQSCFVGVKSENGIIFRENLLFTHRGLSGPAILQISSYWQLTQSVVINLLPDVNLEHEFEFQRNYNKEIELKTFLAKFINKKIIETIIPLQLSKDGNDIKKFLKTKIKSIRTQEFNQIKQSLQAWKFTPNSTEGYRTAEISIGGVNCDEISSKTFESKFEENLYFCGEVLDVSGWLGGYNLQWAWASGWCAIEGN